MIKAALLKGQGLDVDDRAVLVHRVEPDLAPGLAAGIVGQLQPFERDHVLRHEGSAQSGRVRVQKLVGPHQALAGPCTDPLRAEMVEIPAVN